MPTPPSVTLSVVPVRAGRGYLLREGFAWEAHVVIDGFTVMETRLTPTAALRAAAYERDPAKIPLWLMTLIAIVHAAEATAPTVAAFAAVLGPQVTVVDVA